MPYESTIPTYMRYFRAVLRTFVCASSNFQNKFPFCVLLPLMKRQGVANIFHARCVILKMSVYSLAIARECDKCIRDAQSRNEKWIYFMFSNNKFLGKRWYGRHPWIRLAMDCEIMVEKGINFIFCLGTAYDISSKMFLSPCFSLWALAPLQIPTSLREGPFFYFMKFLFFESPSSLIKATTRRRYDHT